MWFRGLSYTADLRITGASARLFALMLAAFVVLPAPAVSSGRDSWLESVRDADAPDGFAGVCARYRWACARGGAKAAAGQDTLAIAEKVNLSINRRTREISDEAQYRQREYWALPTSRGGDCEDFALAKKQALIAKGVAPEQLLIATVLDRKKNPHAVLVLRSDKGDFVLDNLTNRILGWRKTGYTFLRMQNPASPDRWSAILRGGILGG